VTPLDRRQASILAAGSALVALLSALSCAILLAADPPPGLPTPLRTALLLGAPLSVYPQTLSSGLAVIVAIGLTTVSLLSMTSPGAASDGRSRL
jgi:hypothetical protein